MIVVTSHKLAEDVVKDEAAEDEAADAADEDEDVVADVTAIT